MALLNARAMVNYEAGTVRTRAGLECLGQKGEAGGGSRARGRGPSRGGSNATGASSYPECHVRLAAYCLRQDAFLCRRRGRGRGRGRGLLVQCGITQGCHTRADPAPLPHRARFWAQKQAETGPSGLFFSPRICACAECAGVLGEEGGWRGARAARKTAIPRCWRRDRPRMAPALHRHRRLRPAGRPAGPNTCPGGQAGGMQRAPAAARPRRAG